MAYFKMSFGHAISMALLSVSYVTGITSTVGSPAEHAVHSFADTARMHEFEFAILSNGQEWYVEGMKLFAFVHSGRKWQKRTLTWSVLNVAPRMTAARVNGIMAAAFAKWAKVSPFTFRPISPGQRADIRIQFGMVGDHRKGLSICKPQPGEVLDNGGVDITFSSSTNWADIFVPEWYNLRYCALFEIGRALGLDMATGSDRAVMYKHSYAALVNYEPDLTGDDIHGIQELYTGVKSPLLHHEVRSIPIPIGTPRSSDQ